MAPRALSPRDPWSGRRVVLGVTGGIAAYKTVQLARDLTRLGSTVDVVLSRGAQQFVRPLAFEGVTGRPPLTELFSAEGAARHISLGRDADAILVAPATADFLSRASQGRADDLLTTTLLATRAPVLLAPAMNDRMWAHPAVQENAARCAELGYRLVGPVDGALAVGEGEGPGRMADPDDLVQHLGRALCRPPRLDGQTVLLTSGGTREPLDPVRFLGNRSSGRMGHALALAAWRRGAEVVLVTAPTALRPPTGVEVVPVGSALEMEAAVRDRIGGADILVFAAAVADFRPADPSGAKVKRSEVGDRLEVELVANPDITAGTRELRKEGHLAVGFALETEELLENARKKREEKGLHWVVANPAGDPEAGFEAETNRVTVIGPDGAVDFPLEEKEILADRLWDHILGAAEG